MSDSALAPLQTDWLQEAHRIAQLPSHPQLTTLRDTQRLYRFLKALADGNYPNTAIKLAGFHTQTLYDWKTYAKHGEVAAIALVEAMEKAESEAEGEMVNCVRNAAKAGPQFWAAGMTYLERRQPDRWGKRPDDQGVPKVVVQIGIQSTDVQVNLTPSPQYTPLQSETPQIPEQNPSLSDNTSYVNQTLASAINNLEGLEGRKGEGNQALPARDPQGDPPPALAPRSRQSLSRVKRSLPASRRKKG